MTESKLVSIVESVDETNGLREKLIGILEELGYIQVDCYSNQELLEEFTFVCLDVSGK